MLHGVECLLLGLVWLNQHLAEFLELLRTANLLSEEGKLDDVEELVIKLVRLIQILLLHGVPDATVLAVGV